MLNLLRVAGLVVIALLLRFPPEVYFPKAGVIERFTPWIGQGPDERWDGCWLADVAPVALMIRFQLRCSDGRTMDVTIAHSGDGLPPGGSCSLSPAAATFLQCGLETTLEPDRRDRLLLKFRAVVEPVLTRDAYHPQSREEWLRRNAPVIFAVFPLVAFLWLVMTGAFGVPSVSPEDWPALFPFLVGLIARQELARHTLEEIGIHFHYQDRFIGVHSFIVPTLEAFVQPLGRDPFALMMNVNGVMGALATLPLYLFVRERTGDRSAALLAAVLFAVHPVITRFAPSDGPYSFLFLFWFSGLAFLSKPAPDARSLFAGAALLGLAAACRGEGPLYLLVSLLLLDLRALTRHLRAHPGASALASILLLGLLAAHAVLIMHLGGHMRTPYPLCLGVTLRTALGFTPRLGDRVFGFLLLLGALAGFVGRAGWLGPGAVAAEFVLLLPFGSAYLNGYSAQHYAIPAFALQTVAGGVGAAWLLRLLPRRLPPGRMSMRTGGLAVLLAGYVLGAHRRELDETNAVDEEYRILRDNLAPGGKSPTECTLLTVPTPAKGDVDIKSFGEVLPDMRVLACTLKDCRATIKAGGCAYYLRSMNCLHGDGSDRLDPACTTFEQSLVLAPVDERVVHPREYWLGGDGRPFRPARYPEAGVIGLYRVLGPR